MAQTEAAREGNVYIEQSQEHYAPNLNSGIALGLFDSPGFAVSTGLSIKYNKQTKNFKPGAGITIKTPIVNFGAGYFKDSLNNDVYTTAIGAKLTGLMVDYSILRQLNPYKIATSIFSATYSSGVWSVTYAKRKQRNSLITPDYQQTLLLLGMNYQEEHTLLGITYKANDKWGLGYFSNYILGSGSSFVFQYLF